MNKDLKKIIFKGVGLAMGVATLVLNILKALDTKNAITLISIGLVCLAISQFEK